jgi:hypothetical protein
MVMGVWVDYSLFENDRNKLNTLGKQTGSVLRVHQILQQKPIISIAKTAEETGLTVPTINSESGVILNIIHEENTGTVGYGK